MFLKNSVAYSGTNIVAQMALFIQGFILRGILPPQIMGVWNFVGVVKKFVSPFSMGLLVGAVRELPILKGRSNDKGQADCRSVCLTYSLAEVTIVAICVIFYAFLKKGSISYYEYFALIFAAILLIFTRVQESYTIFFQGMQQYVPLSRLLFINSMILAVFLSIGAITMGLWGVFIAALFSEVLKAAWMIFSAKHFGILPKIDWNIKVFKRLASYSVVYKIADYPMVLCMMLDVLWITKFMGLSTLAIYAMARGFFWQGSDIPSRISTVFFTKLMQLHGGGVDRREIAAKLMQFIVMQLLILVPLLCWLVNSTVPFLVRNFIPKYSYGIPAIMILIIGNFFIPQNSQIFSLWLMEKRLKPYGISNLFGLCVMLSSIIFFWFVLGQKTINGIAFATLTGYILHFLYIIIAVGCEFWKPIDIAKIIVSVFLMASWTGFILWGSGQAYMPVINWNSDISITMWTSIMAFLKLFPALALVIFFGGIGKLIKERWKKFHTLKAVFYG